MSVSLVDAVPAGAIEVMFDEQNQPCFKRADLGQFLGLADIRHMFKNIATKKRYELLKGGGVENPSLLQRQNDHDAFVTLIGCCFGDSRAI